MGVTLQHRTIHKRTGVTLVGVHANVLHVTLCVLGELPLQTGGETCTATATQTATFHHVNNLLGGHGGQHLNQSLIAVQSNILVDIFGVDHTAVTQSNTLLLLVELGVRQTMSVLTGITLHVQQTLYQLALDDMLVQNFFCILSLHLGIEGAVGIDDHDGACGTKTETTRHHDFHVVLKTLLLNLRAQLVDQFSAVVGGTTGTAAN